MLLCLYTLKRRYYRGIGGKFCLRMELTTLLRMAINFFRVVCIALLAIIVSKASNPCFGSKRLEESIRVGYILVTFVIRTTRNRCTTAAVLTPLTVLFNFVFFFFVI